MTIHMSFKHMDPSDAIKAYASKRSERLMKYFNGKISINWNFDVEKQQHVAHCRIVGNNMDYFGQAETEELHASIDMVVDKIEKQLKKHKEIVKDHLHRPRAEEGPEAAVGTAEEEEE